MHACPDCGQACDCDGEDTWMDAGSEDCRHECEDEDDGPGYEWDRDVCTECSELSLADCQCCGAPLCLRHSETGGGFCKHCPTDDWISDQVAQMQSLEA